MNKYKISYLIGYTVSWLIIFLGVFINAVEEWGFLLAIMFGWIPALIAATVISLFWPLLVAISALTFILSLFFP